MKFLGWVFLIICFTFYKGYGQSNKKIAVPLLKENLKIDSLMDFIMDPNNKDEYEKPNNSNDSCFFIAFFKFTDHYSFQVEKDTKSVINKIVNRFISSKGFGCFRYKNHNIFVLGVNELNGFFDQTRDSRNFDFVYNMNDPSPFEPQHYLAIWHYQYEKGHFSVEGPPSIK